MKRISFLILFIVQIFAANAQILKPAKLVKSSILNYNASTQEAKLRLEFEIDKGWYIYSSEKQPDGPQAAELDIKAGAKAKGKLISIKPSKHFDDIWGGDISIFEEKAVLEQSIILNAKELVFKYNIQTCSNVEGKCINDSKEIKLATQFVAKESTIKDTISQAVATLEKVIKDTIAKLSPNEAKKETATVNVSSNKMAVSGGAKEEGLFGFLLVAFLAGLAALITPCVFPMIPMTVSFFTHSYTTRSKSIISALVYGLSIVVIYTLIGTLFALVFGSNAANFLSTHWLPNIIFFSVFVFFALSFLGMFEITLPSSLVNSVDAQAEKGGYYGVFFMALTIVLVSFSCTGPIVSSLLVEAAGGKLLKPALGMAAFGSAFAIPFTLFAIFPSWLSSLPKSGGWLNSVKVTLGFVELALSFKFLCVADQAYHWNLMSRDLYIAILVTISLALGAYLLGMLKLSHDDTNPKIGVPRLLLGLTTIVFAIYLIPGLFGAPLKPLSGYLPPIHTLQFILGSASHSNNNVSNNCEAPLFKESLHNPADINGYFDLEQALACAKSTGKPVFVDFTGHGCVNCRKMEESVFTDNEVNKKLGNDFVFVSLYVDDKVQLPENKQRKGSDGELKTTLGDYNADLQLSKFNSNAQPQYWILTPNGDILTKEPYHFDLDINKFNLFLQEGLNNYQKTVK